MRIPLWAIYANYSIVSARTYSITLIIPKAEAPSPKRNLPQVIETQTKICEECFTFILPIGDIQKKTHAAFYRVFLEGFGRTHPGMLETIDYRKDTYYSAEIGAKLGCRTV